MVTHPSARQYLQRLTPTRRVHWSTRIAQDGAVTYSTHVKQTIPTTNISSTYRQPGLKRAYKSLKQPEGETADKSVAWLRASQKWDFLAHVGLATAPRSRGGECHLTATLLFSHLLLSVYRQLFINSCLWTIVFTWKTRPLGSSKYQES